MAGEDSKQERMRTETEHLALLEAGIARETASLRAEKEDAESTFTAEKSALQTRVEGLESEKAELQTRIDVLDAEKAAETKRADEIQAQFDGFKGELERANEVQAKKADRVTRVKAAKEGLDEAYFTDERVTRWAEMADEQFDSLIADLTEAKTTTTETASGKSAEDLARETAAFAGGKTSTSVQPKGGAFAALMAATTNVPASIVGIDSN